MITRFSIVALVVFLLSVVFVIFSLTIPIRLPFFGKRNVHFDLRTAPILAIVILWAAQCLGPMQIRDGIVGSDGVKPYNILILFFSLAYMAITLDITGILQAAAFWVSNKGGSNGWKLYFYFYLMLTSLSVFLGNDPVILSGTVFLVYYTSASGLEPIPWLMAEFSAANTASMVLFVGNPTNVVICEGFSINNAAFTAYTILPFAACILSCFFALAFQFRDKSHIPRRIQDVGHLNPREALKDPVGAWVGSVLLACCLVAIIVASFFHVDVWMISMPFAVVKCMFDFAWDYYRFVEGATLPDPGQGETVVESDPKAALAETQTYPPKTVSSNDVFPSRLGFGRLRRRWRATLVDRFPTFFTALPRLPFALVPFAFSQFILIETLDHQGWIDVFATWLSQASKGHLHASVWLIGTVGVFLCNIAGTNIGATILLTKVIRAAGLSPESTRAAGIALAVSSNIGAVSFTYSASLAGLLWKRILEEKGIWIGQWRFAYWNVLPLLVMTGTGLAVVSAEMAVLYR